MPELIDRKLVYNGKAFSVYKYTANVDGEIVKRDIIERKHGVVIVPVDNNNNVLLIREYCAGSNSFVLSLPGGSIEGNGDVEEQSLRELREETGFTASNLVKLQYAYTHPSTTNRKSYAFLAYGLNYDPLPSSGEIIKITRMPIEDALIQVYQDFESDVSTIGNLLMARDKLKSLGII